MNSAHSVGVQWWEEEVLEGGVGSCTSRCVSVVQQNHCNDSGLGAALVAQCDQHYASKYMYYSPYTICHPQTMHQTYDSYAIHKPCTICHPQTMHHVPTTNHSPYNHMPAYNAHHIHSLPYIPNSIAWQPIIMMVNES
jgi:hypothetical protein